MKNVTLISSVILLFISNASYGINSLNTEKTTLSGKITDKNTGEPLPGVYVYLPDLKSGAVSDDAGNYKIENLPQAKVLIQVSFIGYKLISETIDLSIISIRDFEMEEAINELNEVVVTGLSRSAEKSRTPAPISTIPPTVLVQSISPNIIDAISRQPGLSQVTTGSGISKPVIRGLGFNRVVTVSDGIRQEGQQWGDEHGIEIDEYAIRKVEILKGPASLTYGSDAMAGVINLFSTPTLPAGVVEANVLANYQTNDGLIGFSANMSGNKNGIIWDVRYSNKMAHAYRNKYDGYVFNSGYKENTLSGIAGVNRSWGYSHLFISAYHMTPGIVEGDRDSTSGLFVKPAALNDTMEEAIIVSDKDFKSYNPFIPFQEIDHYKLILNNSFIIGQSSLKATLGWQQNRRKEFSDLLHADQFGLYFLLYTFHYDIRYLFNDQNDFDISAGLNGMYQLSQNEGTEFLIPEYHLLDAGLFGLAHKSIEKLDISLGIRVDVRNETAEDLYLNAAGEKTTADDPEAFHQFSSFHSIFNGVSGSAGIAYQFSKNVFAKLNLARGFRAPNIAELSANGVHEGTLNYIVGVPSLKPENSLQFDLAFGLNTEHITGELDLFSNSIQHFIFLHKLESVNGGDSITQDFKTFTYAAGDADLIGGEITIDIHPHPFDWLHFENSFSYVNSTQRNQPDSTKYLPFTPGPKWISEIRATTKKIGNNLANCYFKIGVENYFRQNHFYSAFGTETATPGYLLLDLGIGSDIISNKSTLCSVFISANNLTDVAFQSHLSRLKYADVNQVTGRTGVYNMGRNISFKIIVPIELSK
jgi:iron complex outermembrane receptor protein